jgi:hypothetical protein
VLEQAFDRAGTRIAYRIVTATTGKLTRAEPVAALYEQGRVSHIGFHPELEEQLLGFTAAPGEKSPDRLDAAVHAITDLMGYGLHLHGDERSAVAHLLPIPESKVALLVMLSGAALLFANLLVIRALVRRVAPPSRLRCPSPCCPFLPARLLDAARNGGRAGQPCPLRDGTPVITY